MAMINCPECGKEISNKAESCPNCGAPIGNSNLQTPPHNPVVQVHAEPQKKKGSCLKTVLIVLGVIFLLGIIGSALGGNDEKEDDPEKTEQVEAQNKKEDSVSEKEKEKDEPEQKDKYHVGDTWENKTLRMTYTSCYEFTDYDQFNAPADGNKIICAEFEFENIGNSDTTVMYTEFHGYADGYEVSQSYAPDGTGLDFSVKMSAGRKGTGKVAFEVPENAEEIEIEFSPNFWTSENIIFIYE